MPILLRFNTLFFVNTQLGYQLLYLLADFDSLARTVMTASHIALLTKDDAYDWLESELN